VNLGAVLEFQVIPSGLLVSMGSFLVVILWLPRGFLW
jgi:hypothetical protein